jgi:hypothetical protein
MSERENKLSGAWLGEITLAGKPLRNLTAGHILKLRLIGNSCFVKSEDPDELSSMIEVVFAMSLAKDEFKEYTRKHKSERDLILSDFAMDHADELEDVIAKVVSAISLIEVAKMESEATGKEIRHA